MQIESTYNFILQASQNKDKGIWQLQDIEINGLTVSSVAVYGSQRGHLEVDRAKVKN